MAFRTMNQFLILIPILMLTLLSSLFSANTRANDSASPRDAAAQIKAGQHKAEICAGCHSISGYRIAFPEVYRVPKLGGQNAKYIETALRAYKKGERKSPTMYAITASLSDQDIADIAAYYAAQGPTSQSQSPSQNKPKP